MGRRSQQILGAATAMVLIVLMCLIVAPGALAVQEVKLGIVTTPGSAQYICAEKFAELVAERSGGAYEIKLFHSGSLGTETEILQQIQLNALHMGIITLGPFDVFVPTVRVVDFPFMFRSYGQVDAVLDGELGQRVLDSLTEAGFKGLAFSENGFRHLTNGKRPVRDVGDVKGLKIRVMESELHKELWRTLGANPTPMGWPIYSELQQGTIDGQENPLSVIVVYKLSEVQKHLTLTGHVYSAHINVANLNWFNGLDQAAQDLFTQAARDAARFQRAWNRDNEDRFLATLKEQGMQVVEDPDIASFRERSQALRSNTLFKGVQLEELLDAFLEATH
jgi:tripartite ATP-independent transporter DctP family solute receptor